MYVHPRRASTPTRTWTCPSAEPPPPTISRPARAPRPSAAPPPSWTSPSRPGARACAQALDTWWKKAEGRACIDYGLHMIVTDLGGAGLEDMDEMVREGVASFKLFMAYPNVLMVDDATIFKALSQTAKNGALICMHAENGSVIDVHRGQRALAEGKTAPDLPRAHPPAARRGGGGAPGHRPGGDRRRAGLHRAPLLGGRAERGAGGARPRRAGLRRDLPAVPAAVRRRAGAPGLRGGQVRLHPAAAPEGAPARSSGKA